MHVSRSLVREIVMLDEEVHLYVRVMVVQGVVRSGESGVEVFSGEHCDDVFAWFRMDYRITHYHCHPLSSQAALCLP